MGSFKYYTLALLLIFVFAVAVSVYADGTDSGGKNFLADKHQKLLGGGCEICHAENPPSKDVTPETCIGCHGKLTDFGKDTKAVPNPHINHVRELYCDDCHHGHKESEIYCNQCHAFKLQAP